MADELVFSVDGVEARPAAPITLAEAGFTERAHLQEWVLAHPEIIGDGILVVTSEFDAWRSSSGAELIGWTSWGSIEAAGSSWPNSSVTERPTPSTCKQ